MAQVEGGDLMVVQRGRESSGGSAATGWHDGPWWRQSGVDRRLAVVDGLAEGTKLCRASAEGYATEHFAATGRGGGGDALEQARKLATESLTESNPVRTSNLFLAVQAIRTPINDALFTALSSSSSSSSSSSPAKEADDKTEVCFAIFILDPVHEIEFATVSQAVPAQWVYWLDGTNDGNEADGVHAEIRDLVQSGGVDPREWIADWIEETLSLAIGVVAQRYVARRMGIGAVGGDDGIGRGRRRTEDIIQDGAGEAARAGLI